MQLDVLDKLIDNKIEENPNKLVFTYYQMKVKQNLSDDAMLSSIHLISIKLENLGYNVYRTNQTYTYSNEEQIVKNNELLVAIKK